MIPLRCVGVTVAACAIRWRLIIRIVRRTTGSVFTRAPEPFQGGVQTM